MYDSPTNRPRGNAAHTRVGGAEAEKGARERDQGERRGGEGVENETRRPRSCRNTGKLINCSNLSRASPFSHPPPLPPPLSAGIKDPHKFHSARPSTLAGARTGVGSLHPRRRNAPARASGIASGWHPPFEPEKFRKKKRNYTLSTPSPVLLPSSRPRNARDIRPSDKRHNVIYGGYVATTRKKRSRSAVTRLSARFPSLEKKATNPRVFPRA